MRQIYSKNEPDVLMAVISSHEDYKNPRTELVPASEFIQGAIMNVEAGKSFRPHKHIWKLMNSNNVKCQECWIVIQGFILATIYDLDDSILEKIWLKDREAMFTLHAGHTFEANKDSIIFEIKTGPYEGQSKDKVFI